MKKSGNFGQEDPAFGPKTFYCVRMFIKLSPTVFDVF
jgi:hypothetical protein